MKVVEENTFCVFSDKKVRIFMSDREQLQMINEQTFERSYVGKNRSYMNSEIIASEMIKKAGYVVQRNHLYYDRSSKNISKVECFDTGVFKLMPKHLKDTFESLVISIRGHGPL